MNGGVAAILLAAGRSIRMGRCKQLLPIGDTTVIGRCLDTLAKACIAEIVVVVSTEGQAVAQKARHYPVKVVVNSLPNGDMASSVETGREALSADAAGIIVALCDYPLVLPATVARLVAEHELFPDHIIMPCHSGKRGHPPLFPRAVLEGLSGNMTLRDLVRKDPNLVRCIEVEDCGVLIDMDTPEDYRKICYAVT